MSIRRVRAGEGRPAADPRASALSSLASFPGAARGYEEFARALDSVGMPEDAEAVRFLISEKFRDHRSGSDEEQQGDDRKVP